MAMKSHLFLFSRVFNEDYGQGISLASRAQKECLNFLKIGIENLGYFN